MQRTDAAISVKLWALVCTIMGISLTSNMVLTCVLAMCGFTFLAVQRNFRLLRGFGVFYLILAIGPMSIPWTQKVELFYAA